VPNAFTTVHRQLIILLAVRYALPAAYPYRSHQIDVAFDGLIAQRSTSIASSGEKVVNLPVQAPVCAEN
jgi:hypothetical protein